MSNHYVLARGYEAAKRVALREKAGLVAILWGSEAALMKAWDEQLMPLKSVYQPWFVSITDLGTMGWQINLEAYQTSKGLMEH